MTDKFVDINTSTNRLRERTPISTSAGAGDAGKLAVTGSDGKFDPTLIPGIDVTNVVASEALAANDAVNIFDSTGVGKMRKANAATGLEAHGFVPSAVVSGATGRVQLGGEVLAGFTSLTIGAKYFLSDVTPGAVTATAPTTSGYLWQYLGVARSATELAIQINEAVERA